MKNSVGVSFLRTGPEPEPPGAQDQGQDLASLDSSPPAPAPFHFGVAKYGRFPERVPNTRSEEPVVGRTKTEPHLHATTIAEVVAHLRAEDGERAGAGAVFAANAVIEDLANLAQILHLIWVLQIRHLRHRQVHTAHTDDIQPEQQEGVDADCDAHIDHHRTWSKNRLS